MCERERDRRKRGRERCKNRAGRCGNKGRKKGEKRKNFIKKLILTQAPSARPSGPSSGPCNPRRGGKRRRGAAAAAARCWKWLRSVAQARLRCLPLRLRRHSKRRQRRCCCSRRGCYCFDSRKRPRHAGRRRTCRGRARSLSASSRNTSPSGCVFSFLGFFFVLRGKSRLRFFSSFFARISLSLLITYPECDSNDRGNAACPMPPRW